MKGSKKSAWPGSQDKHPVSQCMLRVKGQVDDPGAYCASIADKAKPGWREHKAEHAEGGDWTASERESFWNEFSHGEDERKKKHAEPKSDDAKLRVPLVIGHEEDQELLERTDIPAAGWVDSVKRDGNKLVASVKGVPKVAKEALARKAFRTVSSEIYRDFPDGDGKKSGAVLRRVALLGGEIPKVKTLEDIGKLYKGEEGYDIPRLEIFQAGTYNGDTWTEKDLDDMVTNFKSLTVEPDKHSELASKFSEGSPEFSRFSFPFKETSAMPHDKELLEALSEAGFDTSIVTDETPAAILAEAARVVGDYAERAKKLADEAVEEEEEEEEEEAPAPEEEEEEDEEMMSEFADIEKKIAEFAAKAKGRRAPKGASDTMKSLYGRKDIKDPEALGGWLSRQSEANKFSETSAKVRKLERVIEDRLKAERKAGIDARLKALLGAGKVLPAEIDGGLKDSLYAANDDPVHTFSENGKTTKRSQLEMMFRSLEARPPIAKFAERMGAKSGGTGSGLTSERRAELLGHTHLGRQVLASQKN